MNTVEVLSVRKYKAGYEIRTELVDAGFEDVQEPLEMKNAYTHDGQYIGQSKWAYWLCYKHGIKPEYRLPTSNVCSIGYSEKDNKWYGWSHRAIVGFGIGDRIFEEKYGDETTLFTNHGDVPITTMEDAKKAASNFAEYIS